MAAPNQRTTRELRELGQHIGDWRRVLGMTAQMVAARAGIGRSTLRSIEQGTGTASIENVLAVMRVLGISGAVVAAANPHTTDIGIARAKETLKQRVRV